MRRRRKSHLLHGVERKRLFEPWRSLGCVGEGKRVAVGGVGVKKSLLGSWRRWRVEDDVYG